MVFLGEGILLDSTCFLAEYTVLLLGAGIEILTICCVPYIFKPSI